MISIMAMQMTTVWNNLNRKVVIKAAHRFSRKFLGKKFYIKALRPLFSLKNP